jgi:hypothetical protein
MGGNKGKPSGKYAESKTGAGRKGGQQRSGWPEEAPTQAIESARGQQAGGPLRSRRAPDTMPGRNNRKGGFR